MQNKKPKKENRKYVALIGYDYSIQTEPPYNVRNDMTGKILGSYNQLAIYKDKKRLNVQRAVLLFAAQHGVAVDDVIEKADKGISFAIGKDGAYVESYEAYVKRRARKARLGLSSDDILNEYERNERFTQLCKEYYRGTDNVNKIVELLLSYKASVVPMLRTRVRLPRCIAYDDVFTDAVVCCVDTIRAGAEVIKDAEYYLLRKSIRLAHKAKEERDRMLNIDDYEI